MKDLVDVASSISGVTRNFHISSFEAGTVWLAVVVLNTTSPSTVQKWDNDTYLDLWP